MIYIPLDERIDWRLQHRPETGLMVVSTRGTLLFRFDPKQRMLFCWDKKLGGEVAVRLDDLLTQAQM